MGANDKISNKLDDVADKSKEGLGKVDQAKASLEDAGEKIKDAFKS